MVGLAKTHLRRLVHVAQHALGALPLLIGRSVLSAGQEAKSGR